MTTSIHIQPKVEKGQLLMSLLDKILGTSKRKPKKVVTDPAALRRIEQTQSELEAKFNMLDERMSRVEDLVIPKGE